MCLILPAVLVLALTQLDSSSAFSCVGVARNSVGTKLDAHANVNEGTGDDSTSGRMSRRQIFGKGASATAGAIVAASALSLPGITLYPRPADAASNDDPLQTIIPQKELLASLASAPVRNVIITGANSGVGLAGSKLLVAAGHHVTLACRTQDKADAAAQACLDYAASTATTDAFFPNRRPGGTATGAECDLSSMASIRKFAESMKDSPIDALALNAGFTYGAQDFEIRRTKDGFEETVGVNHLGHFYLANLLAPTLAKGGGNGVGPRLVSTASGVHDPNTSGGDVGSPATLGSLSGFLNDGPNFTMVDGGSYDPDKAYKDSKLCNMMFMLEASRRFNGQFTVNAFSPGLIPDPNGFFRNQNKAFATVFNRIGKVSGVTETNEFGGSALAFLAVDPAMNGKTGGWYDDAPPGKHQLGTHKPSIEAQNMEEQKLLWELSSKLVGI